MCFLHGLTVLPPVPALTRDGPSALHGSLEWLERRPVADEDADRVRPGLAQNAFIKTFRGVMARAAAKKKLNRSSAERFSLLVPRVLWNKPLLRFMQPDGAQRAPTPPSPALPLAFTRDCTPSLSIAQGECPSPPVGVYKGMSSLPFDCTRE